MSADNMLVCSPVGDKWWITQEFASDETMRPVASHNWKLGPFDTKEAALLAAFDEENKDYYEYGTTVCETEILPII